MVVRMILNPQSASSQTVLINALKQTINQYPVCEAWLLVIRQLKVDLKLLDSQSLVLLSKISNNLTKVFDHITGVVSQEVTSLSYLQTLSINSHKISVNSRVLSINLNNGIMTMSLNNQAISALSILSKWDPAQNLFKPTDPGSAGYQLVNGITIS